MSEELSKLSLLPKNVKNRILGFVAADHASVTHTPQEPKGSRGNGGSRMDDLIHKGYLIDDNLFPLDGEFLKVHVC